MQHWSNTKATQEHYRCSSGKIAPEPRPLLSDWRGFEPPHLEIELAQSLRSKAEKDQGVSAIARSAASNRSSWSTRALTREDDFLLRE